MVKRGAAPRSLGTLVMAAAVVAGCTTIVGVDKDYEADPRFGQGGTTPAGGGTSAIGGAAGGNEGGTGGSVGRGGSSGGDAGGAAGGTSGNGGAAGSSTGRGGGGSSGSSGAAGSLGSGGSAGTAGAGGLGGAGGSAGMAGSTGTGGSGGSAGSATGGVAGNGGAAGSAGTGGSGGSAGTAGAGALDAGPDANDASDASSEIGSPCGPGTKFCGLCVATTDPNYGCAAPTCTPCESNGTATCSGGSCLVTGCSPGYHIANNQCVPNVPEVCTNGVDDDGDARVDCLDTDCNLDPSCAGRCIDAATIACDSVVTGQSTSAAGSTQRIVSYNCSGGSYPGREYAYRVTGAATQRVYAEVYGLSGNLGLFQVGGASGTGCTAATACGASSDAVNNSRAEALGFTAQAGQDYYIVVDGPSAQQTQNYSLSVQCSAVDGCWPVRPIEAGQILSATNNPASGALNVSTRKVPFYDCYGIPESGPEVAWMFTPTVTASYRVNVNNLTADCDLFILSAGDCGGTCLGPMTRSIASDNFPESVTFNGVANTTYYIVVDGYMDAICNFNIALTQL